MSWKTLKEFFEAFICETVLITNKQFSFLPAFDMTDALFILKPMQKKLPCEKKKMLISKAVNIKNVDIGRNADIERNDDIEEWILQFVQAIYMNDWN